MKAIDAKRWLTGYMREWNRGYPMAGRILDEALLALIREHGGAEWIKVHRSVLYDDPEVLHCAGSRMDEMLERSKIIVVEFEGTTIYIRPSDAATLIQ